MLQAVEVAFQGSNLGFQGPKSKQESNLSVHFVPGMRRIRLRKVAFETDLGGLDGRRGSGLGEGEGGSMEGKRHPWRRIRRLSTRQ